MKVPLQMRWHRLLDCCRDGRLIGLSLALLFSAIAMLGYSNSASRQGAAAVVAAEQRLADVVQREAAAGKASELASMARGFSDEAAASGFAIQDWSSRQFNMKQVSMSRQTLNTLLTEVRRVPGHLFGLESFDLSVKQQDQDLFSTPSGANSELMVSLRGTLMFRVEKARP